MQAHGASVGAPRAYLESIRSEERRTSATHPEPVSGAPHGAAPAEDEWTWLVGTKATPSAAEPEPAPDDSHTIPARDDTTGVERHLAWLAAGTGALGAAVFERRDGRAEPFAAHGSEDRWLYALADLALRADTPQVVVRLRGGAPGVWGAWPFRVHERRLVIAAGGMRDAAPADAWERAAFELESTWNLSPSDRDPERTFREAWLTPAEFRGRLRRAVERHQQEETNFAVHRIHVESGPVELLCQRLPAAIRATDSLCRVEPGVVLLLLTGSAAAARPVRERILRLWTECHDGGAVAGIADERIALTRPEDAEAFLANATRWLASL
jgi:hypothetical protein